MPMKLGEILEKGQKIAKESGLDRTDLLHSHITSEISASIILEASRIHYELHPDAKGEDNIDMEIELPNVALFQILQKIELINNIADRTNSFFNILSPDEQIVFGLFVQLINMQRQGRITKEEMKQIIKSKKLPELSNDSIVKPVMEAFISDRDSDA